MSGPRAAVKGRLTRLRNISKLGVYCNQLLESTNPTATTHELPRFKDLSDFFGSRDEK